MKHSIIISLLLTVFFSLYPETKIPTRHTQRSQNFSFFKKAIESHAKPAIAATSMGAGIHLLYCSFSATRDISSSPQQNSHKGITLNTLLGAGLLLGGAYFFKYIWNDTEEKNQTCDMPMQNS